LSSAKLKKGIESAQTKLETAKQTFETTKQNWEKENAGIVSWTLKVRILAILIALFLIIDAFLIPKMYKKCKEKEALEALEKKRPKSIIM